MCETFQCSYFNVWTMRTKLPLKLFYVEIVLGKTNCWKQLQLPWSLMGHWSKEEGDWEREKLNKIILYEEKRKYIQYWQTVKTSAILQTKYIESFMDLRKGLFLLGDEWCRQPAHIVKSFSVKCELWRSKSHVRKETANDGFLILSGKCVYFSGQMYSYCDE